MRLAKFRFIIAALTALNVFSASAVSAAGKRIMPYKVNERLEFDVSYFGVVGGTTALEVKGIKEVNGRDAYHVVSTARTNKFFSKFFKVRDKIETYIDVKRLNSLKLKIDQREGKHKKKAEVYFDQENQKAIHIKKHNRKIVYNTLKNVQDSLSSLFYIRTKELKVGKDITFNTYASRKSWKLIIKVLKKETIEVKAGTFKTVLIQPLLKHNDVFVNKGDVYIWLSDDVKKIPVKMKSKLIIGAFTAELTKRTY